MTNRQTHWLYFFCIYTSFCRDYISMQSKGISHDFHFFSNWGKEKCVERERETAISLFPSTWVSFYKEIKLVWVIKWRRCSIYLFRWTSKQRYTRVSKETHRRNTAMETLISPAEGRYQINTQTTDYHDDAMVELMYNRLDETFILWISNSSN